MAATAHHEDAPLLGRLEEQSLLTSFLDDIRIRGQALVVHGEPGIGKSRLLWETERTARERGMGVGDPASERLRRPARRDRRICAGA
jgi:predicted ATP-dependent serine protease